MCWSDSRGHTTCCILRRTCVCVYIVYIYIYMYTIYIIYVNSVLHLGTCMKVCPPSARSGPKSGGSGRARRHRHACGVRTLPRFGCRSEDTPTVRTTGEDTRSRPRPEKRKSRRWGARVVWGNGVVTVESLPVWIHLGFHIGSGATADRRKIRLHLLLRKSSLIQDA